MKGDCLLEVGCLINWYCSGYDRQGNMILGCLIWPWQRSSRML